MGKKPTDEALGQRLKELNKRERWSLNPEHPHHDVDICYWEFFECVPVG